MGFTPSQQDAIDAFGGSVIVSAAAGSGKTRVLVQRVIKLLTDPQKPIDADRLLIVTFTKAAADEMRGKISDAIEKCLIEDPDNTLLRRQQFLIANADISTIHSFCSKIIKENFFLLDIDQDFRVATGGEADVLMHRILSDLIEERINAKDEGFLLLSDLLSSSRNDKGVEKTLLDIYGKANSHPFPQLWLDTVSEYYDPAIPFEKTGFALVAVDKLREKLADMKILLDEAGGIIETEPAFCTGTATCGQSKLNFLRKYMLKLEDCINIGDWDKIADCISGFEKYKYIKPKGKKAASIDEGTFNYVRSVFTIIDDTILNKLMPVFGIKRAVSDRAAREIYPAVKSMCTLLSDFDSRYYSAKKERGLLDFNDLEHLMLKLLYEVRDDKLVRTDFAASLSERYDQIMVDEYQDTNDSQESIFRAISKDETNLFTVGDVKQSIYRFREAMPQIFKNRREKAKLYNRNAPEFPAKIILDKNFRSREGIIDSVNFVFHTLMSERVGELIYNDEEKLTAGAEYPESSEPSTEIHILDVFNIRNNADAASAGGGTGSTNGASDGAGAVSSGGSGGSDEIESAIARIEAKYIASVIKEKIKSGMLIKDENGVRPVTYGDFAILMRILSTSGQEYADTLTECGIPTYIDKPYSLFGCYEVNVIISLLRIIDNPLQDIPMLSVMMSPVFGFTADDLTDLKTNFKGRNFYSRLWSCAEEKESADEALHNKCRYFFDTHSKLRSLSVTNSSSRVLNHFFAETGYISVMSASENGDIRVKNIRKLLGFITEYEGNGRSSVTDIVRYINHLEENDTDITVSDNVPANAVKLMTIHHSKGLEFPVCILAGLDSEGSNKQPEILCHTDLGFGMNRMDREDLTKYKTVQRNIISMLKDSEEPSEKMRVLYVALTRAKEMLIPVISFSKLRSANGLEKKLNSIASSIMIRDGRIAHDTVSNTGSLAEWLTMCALVHPSLSDLRAKANTPWLPTLPTNSVWSCKCISELPSDKVEQAVEKAPAQPDEKICTLLDERSEYKYPYKLRTEILSKVSASALAHNANIDFQIAISVPAFMQEDSITGAERGTAVHTFLQFADFGRLETDLNGEKQRLVECGHITQQQADAVSAEDIRSFTQSGIFAHIKNADRVLREHRFTVNIPASDVNPSYPSDESVILQGAIDCMVFEPDGIIVIDYKTDRVKRLSELTSKYKKQLLLYRRAADQLFDVPVKKLCIYSIHLGGETEIPFDK